MLKLQLLISLSLIYNITNLPPFNLPIML